MPTGFTCSRRAYQQGSFGYLATQLGVSAGVFQELYNLFDLLFGLRKSGHIVEGYLHGAVLVEKLSFGLAHVEHAAATAALVGHTAGQINPEDNKEDNRPEGPQDVGQVTAVFVVDLGIEPIVLDPRVERGGKAVARRYVGVDNGFPVDFIGLENSFGRAVVQLSFDIIFLGKDGDLRDAALFGNLFKFRPVHLLAHRRVVGVVKAEQKQGDKRIHPVQVEPDFFLLGPQWRHVVVSHILII